MLDLEFVRAQFPSLGSGFTFLDNAGGSQTLGRVADRVRDYLLSTNVQLGASYTVSVAATERVSVASRAVAAYVNAADPKEIVLGSSTTQLIGNLALALQDEFTAGDEIVIRRTSAHGGDSRSVAWSSRPGTWTATRSCSRRRTSTRS